jgi:universal stress protein E
MFQHILVALDGSESSLLAVDAAIDLAVMLQARLDVLSVEEPFRRFSGTGEQDTVERSAAVRSLEQLQALHLQRAIWNGVQASGSVLTGHAGQMILEYAREEDCDLLVLGHQGRSGVWDTSVGSTAEKLVNHAPCSTLIMRSRADKGLFKRLLVAFDGSPLSWQALHVSLQLKALLNASLHLLVVIEGSSMLSASRFALPAHSWPAHWDQAGSLQLMQTIVEAERQWNESLDEIVAYQGSASEILPSVAHEKRVDLLVLGATGQEHPRNSPLGKTARKVANEALCSVLIVRPLA